MAKKSENNSSKDNEHLIDDGDTIIHEEERTIVHEEIEVSQEGGDEAQEPSSQGARFEVVAGPLSGQSFPIELAEGRAYIVGRDRSCELVLNDGSVSRQHVEIVKKGKVHYVSDLGSSNGTLVDGNLIFKSHPLANGSEVKIGIYNFVFYDSELTKEDMPQQLPVPYGSGPSVGVETYQENIGLEDEDFKANVATKHLVYAYLGLAVLSLFLLVLGVQKILKEDVSSSVISAITDLFQSGPGSSLVYPMLEIKTSPMDAEVYFQGDLIGVAPIQKKIEEGIVPGDEVEIRADFYLKRIDEKVSLSKRVTFNRDQEIVPFLLEAPVGQIHVTKLPKNVQLLLEYTKESEILKLQQENSDSPQPLEAPEPTIKQLRVDYKDPIYVPFGEYKLELRKDEKFRYRRKFKIDRANPRAEFNIQEDDLTYALISIITDPPEADILLDGNLLKEVTPLKDFRLSFGNHKILLRKENYQDYVVDDLPNPLEINEPLTFNIKLPISATGELIIAAKKAYDDGDFKRARTELFKALKTGKGPSGFEKAEIQFLLGQTYLNQNNFKQALIYFRKAKVYKNKKDEKPFYDQAKVGEARVYKAQGKRLLALKLSVEAFFSSKDPTVKSAAQEVFHQVSPAKSVIYVDSQPTGATIFFNGERVKTQDRKSNAKTPLIIPDLPVGGHTIVLSKKGYKDHKEKVRLGASDLKALKVELKPN